MQLGRDRRRSLTKVETLVGRAEMQIQVPVQVKPMTVGHGGLEFVLFAEVSFPSQFARENITAFHLKKVQGCCFLFGFHGRLDLFFGRAGPGVGGENDQSQKENDARAVFGGDRPCGYSPKWHAIVSC